MSRFWTTVPLVALTTPSLAHMIMRYPQPLGNPNSSPVEIGDGSEGGPYPCKVEDASAYESAPMNGLTIGVPIQVSFNGSIVHGGGSCQFSLSKDHAPTVSSIFKVIHSVEGGCPARNTIGNLEFGAQSVDPFTYNVTVPQGIQPGRYTFAWTWVNKVGGQGEYYMNCAAVKIAMTSSDNSTASDTTFDSLPDMVVINTHVDDCERTRTPEVLLYADPGLSLERNEGDIEPGRMILPQCVAGGGRVMQAVSRGVAAASSSVTPSTAASTSTSFADVNSVITTGVNTSTDTSSSSSSSSSSTGSLTSNTPNWIPSDPSSLSYLASYAPDTSRMSSQSTSTSSIEQPTASTSSSTSTLTSTFPNSTVTPSTGISAITCPSIGTSTHTGYTATSPRHPCPTIGVVCVDDSSFINCGAVGECAIVQPVADGTKCVDGHLDFVDGYLDGSG